MSVSVLLLLIEIQGSFRRLKMTEENGYREKTTRHEKEIDELRLRMREAEQKLTELRASKNTAAYIFASVVAIFGLVSGYIALFK